jgi:hypothetical protein
MEDIDTNRLYTYCHRCREHIQEMRGRTKGLEKVRAMKKYGSGKITEPQDLDKEQVLHLPKTAKRDSLEDFERELDKALAEDLRADER